jgi:hypothetical protein
MATAADKTRDELILKEEKLLENGFRKDASRIQGLIDDSCIEIAETGKLCSYKPGDTFEAIDGELYIISDTAKLIELSADCMLLTYVAAKVKKNARIKSTCSSVWKKGGDKWKRVFHQRTGSLD